jgi:hypothetical protein
MRRASKRWGGCMKLVKVPSRKVMEMMQLKKESPIKDEIHPI